MRILTIYLIRAHIGPFLFSLFAITGLLFLNAVAQRLEELAGKGLTWDIIGQFLMLSLPHTVALTLPMAVLVAVLYAFSDLTANNEITAMKAGGIHPQRILLPLIGVGVAVAALMLYFNDRVLPEANHQLKNLLVDIGRKSPTFQLREQVVNEVQQADGFSKVFLTATRIDQASNQLEEVVIYDPNDPSRHRTTYADRGHMAFNPQRTDLYLTLFDGVVYETDASRPGGFQRIDFQRQIVPLRGVGDEMQRRITGAEQGDRSDREMPISMLEDRVDERRAELESVYEESLVSTRETVRAALGLPVKDSTILVTQAQIAQIPGLGRPGEDTTSTLVRDHITQRAALNARTTVSRTEALRLAMSRYEVEIHKKYTLAFACIVFVLLGAPLAVRFPRGGLGLVIAASSVIFAIYWIGLIGGENLADRGITSAAIAMWIPNIIFTAIALLLVRRMGREAATMRGGGWEDVVWAVKGFFARRGARRSA